MDDRFQFVEVNGFTSGLRQVSWRVPQGDILLPVLFLMFIEDLDVEISSAVFKFAKHANITRRLHRESYHSDIH